jgi:hypothetical protein
MSHRLLRAVTVFIAVVGFAGCGASPATSAVGDGFAARAVAVCSAALESKAAWKPFPLVAFDPNDPDPEALGDAAPWLAEVVAPTFEGWRDGLRALGDPPSGQAAWTDLVVAVDSIVAGNEDQIEAALAGDPAAFARATAALQAAQPVLVAAAAAAGVPSCAEVHGS